MTAFYKLNGKVPVPTQNLNEIDIGRRVGLTEIGDIRVSTVFLGVNHNFGGATPLLFETMIFGGPHDQEMQRYSTWDEAENGHEQMVELAMETLNMADGLHEYAFNVTLLTALRMKARTLQEAKDKLKERLDCATINLGEMDDEAIVAEVSMEGEPDLFEFDGEPANDVNGKIQIGD